MLSQETDRSYCACCRSEAVSVKWRDLPALVAAAILAPLILLAGPADWLRGPSLDGLFLLRAWLFDSSRADASPIAIVALDEETYRRHPFRGTPRALWTPEIGRILGDVLDSGASVVGFDLILPTSAEAYFPGHDRQLLLALRQGGKDDRVVLAGVQHQARPISPFPGQAVAVGGGRNIRLANVVTDPDGVVRRVPLWFHVAGRQMGVLESSFALEIADRFLDAVPEGGNHGRAKPGGIPMRGTPEAERLLLNFHAGSANFPVYSLADLHACPEPERGAYFRRHFANKIILFGAVLDAEDRLLTSKRFIGGSERDRPAPRCVHPIMDNLFVPGLHRQLTPGVIVQATAIENLVRNEGLSSVGLPSELGILVLLAAACAWTVLRLPVGWSAVSLAVFGIAWALMSAYLLRDGIMLPGLTLAAALATATGVAVVYRNFVVDREKRTIRRYFSLYLAPMVVDRILATGQKPALGGERREVTVLVSDIAGYTALSERLPPERVVHLLNRYLASATTAVERHGGFVDKFMGDGMLAVFGAPVANSNHAMHAVDAALEFLNTADTDPVYAGSDETPFHTRIGIATGAVVIGNVGSEGRLNYTVIGDAVNLAARLETENKRYGTTILVTEETARAAGLDRFRFVAHIEVRGRAAGVTVYAPTAIAPEPGVRQP